MNFLKSPTISYLQETFFRFKDISGLKRKLWKTNISGRCNKKSVGVAMHVILNRIKDKNFIRDKREHQK